MQKHQCGFRMDSNIDKQDDEMRFDSHEMLENKNQRRYLSPP